MNGWNRAAGQEHRRDGQAAAHETYGGRQRCTLPGAPRAGFPGGCPGISRGFQARSSVLHRSLVIADGPTAHNADLQARLAQPYHPGSNVTPAGREISHCLKGKYDPPPFRSCGSGGSGFSGRWHVCSIAHHLGVLLQGYCRPLRPNGVQYPQMMCSIPLMRPCPVRIAPFERFRSIVMFTFVFRGGVCFCLKSWFKNPCWPV